MGKKRAFCLCLAIIIAGAAVPAHAANTESYDFTYDYYSAVKSVPVFELRHTIDANTLPDVSIKSVDDVYAFGDRIFFVDAVESRMNILDGNYDLIRSVKLFRNEDNKIISDEQGNQMMLKNPEGVFYHPPTDEIYIADTGAERIVVLDGTDYFLKRIITRPDDMIGVTKFAPSKIVLDSANRIYCVVQGGYEGIVELSQDGSFSRYFGVNKPRVNMIDYFWKSIASDEVKQKMEKLFAPPFNNLDIDPDGFIYATSSDNAAQNSVFRLNPKGENVLLNNGYWGPVRGEIIQDIAGQASQFNDITVNDYGVYVLLDTVRGHIFVYDFDGNMLGVSQWKGDTKGDFKAPSAAAWQGDTLLLGDKTLGCVYVMTPTDFGAAALGAVKSYYNGEWEQSAEMAREAIRLNANYGPAFISIGKYHLMRDEFETAMYYFKLGESRFFYSKAFNGFRNIWVQEHFVWFLAVFLIIAAALAFTEYRYFKRRR